MPSIVSNNGSGTEYSFVRLAGKVQRRGETVEEITRPGTDGQAYRLDGKRSRPSVLVGVVDLVNSSAARTLVSALQALRGTLIEVDDEWDQVNSDVMLLDVEEDGEQAMTKSVGGIHP